MLFSVMESCINDELTVSCLKFEIIRTANIEMVDSLHFKKYSVVSVESGAG